MRRQEIANYLSCKYFPNTIACLISNYDCHLTGQTHSFDCFPNRNQPSVWADPDTTIHSIITLHNGCIAIGCNNICKILNMQNGICENIFNNFFGSVSCLAQLKDERIVVCSGIQISQIQIWNTNTNRCDMILENTDMYIKKIVVLSDGRVMGVGSDFNRSFAIKFKIWNINVSSCVIEVFSNAISKCCTVTECIDLHANGDALIVTNHHSLTIWNPQTKRLSKGQINHIDGRCVLLSNGNVLNYQNDKLVLWKEKNNNFQCQKEIVCSSGSTFYKFLELPDERVACFDLGCQLIIIDLRTAQIDMIHKLQSGFNNDIALFANGDIACAYQEGIVVICQ